jgi:hypothetical protein
MKLDPKSAFSGPFVHDARETSLLDFIENHRASLWHAARLLGGFESARLVDRCADLLVEQGRLTPRTRLMLEQIRSLLCLEWVDDVDLPFAGFFAMIDPSDPVVMDICLLSDGLNRALAVVDRA